MDEKPKNSRQRLNRLSFFLLWIILGAGLSAISHNIFLWLLPLIEPFIGVESAWRITLIDALLLAAFTAPVEKILLKLSFGQWIRGWITARFFVTILGVIPYILLQPFALQHLIMNNPQNIPQLALLAALFALPQVWVLRRYVQNAWYYLFAEVLSSLVPVFLVASLQGMMFGAAFTIGASSAIMALMMLWLFRQAPSEEKVKHAELLSHERLEDEVTIADDYEEEEAEQQYEQR